MYCISLLINLFQDLSWARELQEGVVIEDGQLVTAAYRQSHTAWLEEEEPLLRDISRRIEVATGLSLQSAEDFQAREGVEIA